MMGTYQNPLFLPWGDGLAENAGVGDPFVMRFDGRYYLYPSPPHGSEGVDVWCSEDLVTWRWGGLAAQGEHVRGAYAPEVLYVDGAFLMVTSIRGEGHVLLRATDPLGPFLPVRDNFGHVIDGSLFRDDDGSLYFFHAEYPCIHAHTITPTGELGPETVLEGAQMGHWTEGPMVIKRDGVYYLTMTGNHLISRAYRVDYAISTVSPLGPYVRPERATLLVDTSLSHGSLGHSSSVLGPDLDSWWICYHNYLIDDAGHHTLRHANLDRLVFNHHRMMVAGPTHTPTAAPQRPMAEARLDRSLLPGEVWSSAVTVPDEATVEVTLIPDGSEIGLRGGHLRFHAAGCEVCSPDGIVTCAPWPHGLIPAVRHTLRFAIRRQRLCITVYGMTILGADWQGTDAPLAMKGAAEVGYVGISAHAGQRSDFTAAMPVPGEWDAAMFADGTGTHPPQDCGFRPEDGMQLCPGKDGGEDLLLGAGESVTYQLCGTSAGEMQLQAVLCAPCHGLVTVQVGDSLLRKRLDTQEACCVPLGCLTIPEGSMVLSVACEKGTLCLTRLRLLPRRGAATIDLSGLALCHGVRQIEGGALLPGEGGFINRLEGLQMDRPIQALALVGNPCDKDGMIEAALCFAGECMAEGAGVFFRISQDSYYPDQVKVGHRGYCFLVGGGTARLLRMDFDARVLAQAPLDTPAGVTIRLSAVFDGGQITCYADGKALFTCMEQDPWPCGYAGVGSFGARITCSHLHEEIREDQV